MSLRIPKSELDSADDKASDSSTLQTSSSSDADEPAQHGYLLEERRLPKMDSEYSNRFLQTPLSGPIRPLSPDTLSNLSAEDYEQIRPRRLSRIELVDPSHVRPRRSGWRGKLQASWIRNKGLAYMLAAQVFGTLMNVTTRLLEIEGNKGKGLHPVQILFARMIITVVLASAYMWYKKTPHFPFGMPEVRWLLAARGFGGFFGVFGMYYSLLYLPLADATVITFLAPGLACWACSILIKEPFTRAERIGTFISLLGVVLIARPTSFFSHGRNTPPASGNTDMSLGNGTTSLSESDASNYDNVTPVQRLGAVGIALTGVMGAVTAYTTIRWIGKRAHPLISVNYFATWSTIVSLVLQLTVPGIGFLLPADVKEWSYLIFLGTCGFVMQFLLAAGLSYEKSSRATNMSYTQMMFALSFDKLIFGHSPNWMSIVGSSLILGPALYVAVQRTDQGPKEAADGPHAVADEESQQGLMRGMETDDAIEERDTGVMPIQEVQLRALR
jgi:drug/metabolite transporter (DMT)-like permease